MRHLSKIHGCVIVSDLDLHLAPLPGDTPADLTLRRAEDEWDPDWKPEPDDLISDYRNEPIDPGYLSARTADGYRLRVRDYCDYDLNPGLDEVAWRVVPGADPGRVAALAVAPLMALRLMLQGHLVLHASAVSVGGRVLAFVGRSGTGKSTLATLMCRAGASLVTDDVGRVLFDGHGVKLCAGGRETRVRRTAPAVAELMPDVVPRRTGDGWLALPLTGSAVDTVSLDAVVIPRPTRERGQLTLDTINPAETVLLLNRFPRLFGLQDTQLLARQFHQLVDLAERVPVFTATIPWGLSYQPEVAGQLLRALGWEPPPC